VLQVAVHAAAIGHAHGDRAGQLGQVGEDQHVDDARPSARGTGVDDADAGVGVRAADDGQVQGPGPGDVGYEEAAAPYQPLVLAPLEALADVAHVRSSRQWGESSPRCLQRSSNRP
jgi:hypothetical protein